jgi:cold shock CspA family protein
MALRSGVAGRVVEFDDPRGLGVIETEDGERFGFHCTAIADGTRTLAVDTAVRFDVVAGHLGRWEAVGITSA